MSFCVLRITNNISYRSPFTVYDFYDFYDFYDLNGLNGLDDWYNRRRQRRVGKRHLFANPLLSPHLHNP